MLWPIGTRRDGCPPGWSCVSSSRASPGVTCRPSRTWPRRSGRYWRRQPASGRGASRPRPAIRPADSVRTTRSARALRHESEGEDAMKLTANGIDINYEIEGQGPVVTFSHSLACSLAMWDEQAAALRGRYRVLRYDTRGHGGTSAPAGAYTLEQLADDLHALLSGLGITETHFVGLSMGGMI